MLRGSTQDGHLNQLRDGKGGQRSVHRGRDSWAEFTHGLSRQEMGVSKDKGQYVEGRGSLLVGWIKQELQTVKCSSSRGEERWHGKYNAGK